MLEDLRKQGQSKGLATWDIEHSGDEVSHAWLTEQLATYRPDDAVLSEEGHDDLVRVGEQRVWIVDPLDGSSSYGMGSPEWAVHVALVIDGVAVAGAVASPGVGVVTSTHAPSQQQASGRTTPIIVAGRTRAWSDGAWVAKTIDAEVVACSSAGFKAALVATGRADVYVHDSPLYEWDVCAPAVMASAFGLDVSDQHGGALEFNKTRPVVSGLVICRQEFTESVLHSLEVRRSG